MKKLTPFLIWVMLLLYACVPVVQTSEPFQTRTPFTPTPRPTETHTPIPSLLTVDQQAKLTAINETLADVLIIASDGSVTDKNGNTPAGFSYNVDLGIVMLQVGREKMSLSPSQISVNPDGSLHVIGYEIDSATNEWKEIMKFPVRQIENFRECKITEDDILSGRIDKWLETLSKPFDASKINLQADLVWFKGWNTIEYNNDGSPNFLVDGSEPFHQDAAACHLQIVRDGKTLDYIFLPVEFYDKATGKSWWVKTVVPLHDVEYVGSEKVEEFVLRVWRNEMESPIISTVAGDPYFPPIDPLIASTFEKYSSDISARFEAFASGSDMSILSNTDMVFYASIEEVK